MQGPRKPRNIHELLRRTLQTATGEGDDGACVGAQLKYTQAAPGTMRDAELLFIAFILHSIWCAHCTHRNEIKASCAIAQGVKKSKHVIDVFDTAMRIGVGLKMQE